MKYRLFALLLALLLVLTLSACQNTPAETQPPTQAPTQAPTEPPETTIPEPTAPDALDAYSEAVAALEAAGTVTLDVAMTQTTSAAGQQIITTGQEQVLTYSGLGTDALIVRVDENNYDPLLRDEAEEEDSKAEETDYIEYYADGIVYIRMGDLISRSAELSAEELADRYVPVGMLEADLYGEMTAELDGDAVVITFAAPTAVESWVAPEEAQVVEATGSAVIVDGQLQQMNYTVTYTYGPAEITVEAEAKPRQEAEAVAVPEDLETFTRIQYADALKTYLNAAHILASNDSLYFRTMESITSHAGGIVRNQSVTVNKYGREKEFKTKVETGVYWMDYSSGESGEVTQEETYIGGRYTYKVDDGLPTSSNNISRKEMSDYVYGLGGAYLGDPNWWQDVTVEDLGSVLFLTCTLNEDFGNEMQNAVCTIIWDDAGFLNNLASAYEVADATGYIAVDKYTGIITAAGSYYEGVHTIEGTQYPLSVQMDMAVESPSFGAYKEITDELLPEEAPETPATPLFYHVTGADGQEMWLLGTIHVGDVRTGFLPQEIYDAFAASDALAMEIDADGLEKKLEDDEDLQSKLSDLYYYSDGTTAADHIDEETYAQALKYLKASGGYTMNAPYMKLSEWSNSIENFYLSQGHQLHSEQGVEERLTKLAHDQEKEILEVEDVEAHIRTTTDWSDALQALLLKETLEYTAEEYWTSVDELYELWCAGDEAALTEAICEDVDTSEMTDEELQEYNDNLHLYEEYDKTMSYDRNEIMLDVAIDYLEGDKVVFYAVGLAHLLDDQNGLVEALRNAGYTVELVAYQ